MAIREERETETIWEEANHDASVSWKVDYERTRYGDELQYGYDYLLISQSIEGADERRVWINATQLEAIVRAVRRERRKPGRM